MPAISLAQLYNSGYGRSGNAGNVAPPKTELELTSTFTVPALNSTSTADVSTAQYLAVGQFVFLSEGSNYGSFQITAIADKTLTLKNYGGEVVGSVFGTGARLVPSGRDGDDAVPADVVSGATYRADKSVILNSLSGKMAIADYDTDADGVVDVAAGIDGVDAAGNSKYYGTDGTGTPGFHDLPAAPAWGQITGTLTDQTDLNTALNSKEPTITAGTTSQYWRGDKSWQTLDKTAIGLGNVDNTSDAQKPISTATQTALNAKFNNPTGTTDQYVRGDGTLASFPAIPSIPTYPQIATGLNALTGTDRINYSSLQNTPTIPSLTWGNISGILSSQTDLQTALGAKFNAPAGTTAQYIRGDGSLATFPTTVSTYGSFYAASPTVKSIPLFTATRATTINELRGVDTSAGTATISIQINGVNVTGLTNLAVTSTPQNFTATGANTVAIGARVTVNITAVSSAADLEFTMGATLN